MLQNLSTVKGNIYHSSIYVLLVIIFFGKKNAYTPIQTQNKMLQKQNTSIFFLIFQLFYCNFNEHIVFSPSEYLLLLLTWCL